MILLTIAPRTTQLITSAVEMTTSKEWMNIKKAKLATVLRLIQIVKNYENPATNMKMKKSGS